MSEGALPSFAQGNYEPGKRHWLKVKKDYLNEGAMADTADLVVLGAFYGQGSKGRSGVKSQICLVKELPRCSCSRPPE